MDDETRGQSGSERLEDRVASADPRTVAPVVKPRRRWWLFLLFVIVVLGGVALGGRLWFHRLLDGPASSLSFETAIIVVRGSSHRSIVEQLHSAGLLPHPFVFDYLMWRHGKAATFKPGRYVLRSTMSARQIYDAMVRGAPIRITVPESWTIRQIASRLAEEGLIATDDEFTSAACDVAFLNRHWIGSSSAEGYLYPDTYFFDPGIAVSEILETMIAHFARQYADLAARPRPDSLKSWHEVITLASMIEREARNEAEKPLISSVYHNRLRRGMTLDCDATLRYALSKWDEPVTRADLKLDSLYNTYLYKGLPPGPISCVGRTSIEAALSPAQTDFLYYCYRGDNSHQFSKTLAEHNKAVEKFLRKGLTVGTPQR